LVAPQKNFFKTSKNFGKVGGVLRPFVLRGYRRKFFIFKMSFAKRGGQSRTGCAEFQSAQNFFIFARELCGVFAPNSAAEKPACPTPRKSQFPPACFFAKKAFNKLQKD